MFQASLMANRTPTKQLRPMLVVLLSMAVPARASSRLEIPSDCGSAEEYQAGLRARLGPEAAALLDALSVSISRGDQAYRLDVKLGNSTRHIEDQDCRALFRAATVVAVALWESPKSRPDVDVSPGSSLPVTDSSPGLDAGNAIEANTPTRRSEVLPPPLPAYVPLAGPSHLPHGSVVRWRLALHARGGLIAGLVPGTSLQTGIHPTVRYGAVEFGVGASYVFPAEQADSKGRGVRARAIGVSTAVGWHLHPLISLHGGVTGYYVIGSGKGSKQTQTDQILALGPQFGIRVRPLYSRRTWLEMGADAQLELIRPRFEIRAYGEVFRPSWANGSVYLGAGVAFD